MREKKNLKFFFRKFFHKFFSRNFWAKFSKIFFFHFWNLQSVIRENLQKKNFEIFFPAKPILKDLVSGAILIVKKRFF